MTRAEHRLLLAARREQLVRRAAWQRQQLGAAVVPLVNAWHWVEAGAIAWQWLRRHAWLVAAPVALLAWWRPHGALRALAGAMALWRASRSARQRWVL